MRKAIALWRNRPREWLYASIFERETERRRSRPPSVVVSSSMPPEHDLQGDGVLLDCPEEDFFGEGKGLSSEAPFFDETIG